MIINITFKDPDGVYECVKDAVLDTLPDGLSRDEEDALLESRMAEAFEGLKPFITYKEYVSIQFDTEAKTATVL